MIRRLLFVLFLAGIGAAGVSAQRANRIYRPCSATPTQAEVGLKRDGTINILPCSGKRINLGGESYLTARLIFDTTNVDGGTTGNQTINKRAFRVHFAAAAAAVTITNLFVEATSNLLCTVQTNDSTMKSVAAVVSAGTVVLNANAAATAETRVYCEVR